MMAIVNDATRQTPDEWTNANIRELFAHARHLASNGNPSGFLLSAAWEPWVIGEFCGKRYLSMADEWDYDGIRQWISEHADQVATVWQLTVVRL